MVRVYTLAGLHYHLFIAWIAHVRLSARFISETTELISIKFSIGGLHEQLIVIFNSGSYLNLREIVWQGMCSINLAQDKNQWRALVNKVMKFWWHER
jgi:hypothetical protein